MKRAYLVVVVLLVLNACGEGTVPGSTVTTNPRQQVRWGTVEEIKLTDGTFCAVFAGSEGRGGIDCDWDRGR